MVTALGATVDNARSIDVDGTRRSGVTHRFHSLHEVVGGPGTGLLVDILEGTGRLKGLVVDGHTVSGHAQGIHVVGAVQLRHGGDALGNVGAASLPQVGQIHHQALTGVVAHDTLGALENDVGAGASGDGGGQLLITVLIVDGSDGDLDIGILLIESSNDRLPIGCLGKPTDIEGPEVEFNGAAGAAAGLAAGRGGFTVTLGAVAAGGQPQSHTGGEQERKRFLHVHCSSSSFSINFSFQDISSVV